jgi:pimeloyl-ACP methyl ester carboxylesterase
VTRMIRVADRNLAVESWGDPKGKAVFLLHGSPGSRGGPRPRDIVLYRLKIRMISYDRPGYGMSDRYQKRSIADAATDVAHIADALDIDRFSVVGRSGGAPHALACAALLRYRVDRAASLVGLAPPDAAGLDWCKGMTRSNVEVYQLVDSDEMLAEAELRRRAADVQADPERMMTSLIPGLAGLDRRVVNDIGLRKLLTENISEGLHKGADGWIDDVFAFRRQWGFELSAIKAPVLIWHGMEDQFAPVGHSRWLASHIRHAKLQIEHGAAHFAAVEVLPRVLAWLTAPEAASVPSPTADVPG